MDIDGILVVAKPAGMTSHDVVSRVRRAFGMKRVGHAGTLDPDATGVLLVLLGKATAAMQFMVGLPKAYRAEIVIGMTTDTQDASGKVLRVVEDVAISRDRFCEVLENFRGEVSQVPPMVSAVHHGGRRLYELARRGIEVERKARQICIYDLDVESWPVEPLTAGSRVVLSVVCSSGTYVRQLAADIGEELGCGAHLGRLVRTGVGRFDLASSHTLEEIAACAGKGCLESLVVPIARGLSRLPVVTVNGADARKISHGMPVKVPDQDSAGASSDCEPGDLVRVHALSSEGELLCVARVEAEDGSARLRPVRVFAT